MLDDVTDAREQVSDVLQNRLKAVVPQGVRPKGLWGGGLNLWP
jgi:hypothetical protein